MLTLGTLGLRDLGTISSSILLFAKPREGGGNREVRGPWHTSLFSARSQNFHLKVSSPQTKGRGEHSLPVP